MSRLRRLRLDRLAAPAKRLILLAFVLDVGAACVMLALQFRGLELHATPFELGLLLTANFLIYVFIAIISGYLSDLFGRRFVTVIAAGVCTASWLGMTYAQEVWQLLALGVLGGSGLALLWPPVEAWLADLSGNSGRVLNRNLGLFNIAWTAGLMVGPLVAGVAWRSWSVLTFAAAAATGLGCLIIALFTPTAPPADEHVAPPAHLDPRLVTAFLLVAWVGMFSLSFSRGLIGATFPNLATHLQYSERMIGFLVFVLATGQGITFLITRMASGWQFRLWPVALSMGATIVALVVAGLVSNQWVYGASFFIIGGGLGVIYMAGITYALQAGPEGRGRRAGIHEGIMGAGLVTGPALGGLAAQYLTLSAPFLVAGGLVAVCGVAQVILWKRLAPTSKTNGKGDNGF